MEWRNSCAYVDVNLQFKITISPNKKIGKECAYYFACMAYEGLAECAEAGLGVDGFDFTNSKNRDISTKFWLDVLKELEIFMTINNDVNVDKFLDTIFIP